MKAFLVLIVILLAIGVYFLPVIFGTIRSVPNIGSVFVINLFLGWTFIGWVVALAMAARSQPTVQQVMVAQHQGAVAQPSDPLEEARQTLIASREAREQASPGTAPPA